jgi:hypothetical protein
MLRARRLVVVVAAAFAAYMVLKNPTQAAEVVKSGMGQLSSGISAVGKFLNQLIKK